MITVNPSGGGVYVALVHHSMHDKNGVEVTTAVTNLDIHDIARSSRTYGVKLYFLVNPLVEQQEVVKRIVSHWQGPGGREYNPDRSEAFDRMRVVSWLRDAVREIEVLEGQRPELLMTSARRALAGLPWRSWETARKLIFSGTRPTLLVFGTGWGMVDELLQEGDVVLEPLLPERESGFNHLSVRSAAAIALDRLLGER